MEKVLKYIEDNRSKHQDEMFQCLRMETISADPSKEPEIRRCGEWLVKKLESVGFEHACLKETGGFPAVYADWLHAGEGAPTIMVYGHYDVQPVDPIEKWRTPPFEPTVKDGYVYGRGTCDDKCQFLAHIFALEAMLKVDGKLPVNVKVFLESEEEGGKGCTEQFVRDNGKLLACDAVMVSDTAWISDEIPTMIYALRGLAYFQVNITGPNRDLHSGQFGGKVQNPLNAMAEIMASFHDADGRIAVEGIYDEVRPLSDEERGEFAKVDEGDKVLMKNLGVDGLWGEKDYTSNERNWARPALDINGVWGGYSGEGGKTVIPHECGFKVSVRLVADQTVEGAKKAMAAHVKKVTPPGVKAELVFMSGGDPLLMEMHHPLITCAQDSIERAFGKRPALVREGASIPITATFHEALGAPSILMGLGLIDDDIHSPNERFKLDHFYKGVEACAHFYKDAVASKGDS